MYALGFTNIANTYTTVKYNYCYADIIDNILIINYNKGVINKHWLCNIKINFGK